MNHAAIILLGNGTYHEERERLHAAWREAPARLVIGPPRSPFNVERLTQAGQSFQAGAQMRHRRFDRRGAGRLDRRPGGVCSRSRRRWRRGGQRDARCSVECHQFLARQTECRAQ
jgi:hypothetical protein